MTYKYQTSTKVGESGAFEVGDTISGGDSVNKFDECVVEMHSSSLLTR
jgi:hypothetical protein